MKNFMRGKYASLFLTLALFSGMGLMAWFGIGPFQKLIREKADEIQKFHTTEENEERQLGKLPELEKQHELISADRGKLEVFLAEENIVGFIETLEGLAKETGTTIAIETKDGLAIQEKKPAKAPAKKADAADAAPDQSAKKTEQTILESLPYDRYLRLNIVLTGEYHNISAFLHKLEHLPLLLDVIGISFRLRDTSEEKEAAEAAPKNPFMMNAAPVIAVDEAPLPSAAPSLPLGKLEAMFDTVVYLKTKQ